MSPAFLGKDNKAFYGGQSVRGFIIRGPEMVVGEEIPRADSYSLEVVDGQVAWFPERGYYKLSPYDQTRPVRFLYEYDRLVAL